LQNRIIGLLLLALVLVACTGCTFGRPIEELGIIIGIGIDKGEREHHAVTITMPLFEREAEKSAIQLSAEGKNVEDALSIINQNTDKDLVHGQIRTIVIGEELARGGIDEHVDIVTRDPDFPLNAAILVTKGKAKDFLNYKPPENPRIGVYTWDLMQSAAVRGYMMDADLITFYIKKNAEGWDPCLPYLELTDKGIALIGRALFQDTKMIGSLNVEENKILTILDEQVGLTPLSFDDPFEPDVDVKDRKYVNVQINSAKNKVKTRWENGQVKVTMEVRLAAEVVDKESLTNLINPDTLERYEKSFAEQYTHRAERLIAKFQELQTDPLGIGAYFRMQNYKTWKEMGGEKTWRDYWLAADVEVKTEFEIRRYGVIIK